MRHSLSVAVACLAMGWNSLPADPVFDPAKVILVKADDYGGNHNGQQAAWSNFVTTSRNLGVKVGLGVIATRIQGDTTAAQWMQQQQTLGGVEFWNHGWDHSTWTTGGTTFWEFRNSGPAFQQTHFADAQAGILTAAGRDAIAFGAPYNQTDADTMTVMNNTPAVRLFFTYNSAAARSAGLVPRVHTVGIIAEAATGKPLASDFIAKYPDGPAGPVSLQFHPAVFTAADLAEYGQIIQFLQGKGYTFMLPAEYVAALDAAAPAGAKIWTGATDVNWTSGGNWSPSGAPAGTDDVAFTGSGTNLGTRLNGTARSLNSLTFTSGQTGQVTITTTNTAPLILAPAASGTTLGVAAGSHRFIGTDGGSNTPADFRFGGVNGTTHILNIGGSAAFEIKGRIDNGGANTKSFQKTGTGTLVLSANNGGTGGWQHSSGSGFQIQQGALRFAAVNAGGNSANNYLVSNGAALELEGDFNQTLNNGTHTLNGTGIAGTGALRSLGGTKAITGTGTGGIHLASHSTIGVDTGNLTISQVVKGPGSLTKVGAGTLTLTGSNTYSGGTHVAGGTLALGASNVLPATPVSLGAATLSVGAGFAETAGRLDVTGAATIHLGNGSSTIAFADNGDLLAWSGTLNITGTFIPGVSVRFGNDANGLTAAQLAGITVNGSGSFTLNASGYLTGPGTVKSYDVYLIAGQSNADGRGYVSDLTGPLASYADAQAGVKIFYVNPINKDPVNPNYNSGWTTLAPGYSIYGTSGPLPSTRFGFELSLGKALAANDPQRNVAFIKVSQGGTSLSTDWDPASGDNFMWRTLANKVPEAMAALTANGDTAEIRGIFWHQGESDGGNPTYQNDLMELIAAVRSLTGKPNLPFAIGELERDDVTADIKGRSYQLNAMANVAAADPHTFVVSSADLLTFDGTHFTSAAYITFGECFAKAYHDHVAASLRTRFETWAGTNEITFTGDANGDGVADGLAWLLGAGSPAANARTLLPYATGNNGALQAGFAMRNSASRGGAVLSLQYGTTLGSWTTLTVPEESGTHGGVGFSITQNGELNTMVVTIPASLAPDGRLFIRLAGSEN